MMWVGNRKEILKPTFERYPFVRASKSDEGVTLSLSISLREPVQIINVVVRTKLFCNNPHRNGFSFFKVTYLLYPFKVHCSQRRDTQCCPHRWLKTFNFRLVSQDYNNHRQELFSKIVNLMEELFKNIFSKVNCKASLVDNTFSIR